MTQIGKEYGAALFMLGCENHAKQEYAEALACAATIFKENPIYMEFLSSPNISMEERLCAIDEAFAASFPDEVVSYLKLLCEKGRFHCFEESVAEYKKLLDTSEHISEACVTSVVPLTDEQKSRLKEKLEKLCKNHVTVKYAIDATLMGGIVIEVDGKVLDGSLRHRLNEVKDVISR